ANHRLGIPGHQALICLFDADTRSTCAVMDGTYITAARTAGRAAGFARIFAPQNASTLAIIDVGNQGEAHTQILPLVGEFKEIRIASRFFSDAQRVAALDSRAIAIDSFERAVHGADVVCLCTTSNQPVLQQQWLEKGTHITSVGYRPPGGELSR